MKRPAVFFDRDNTLIVSDGYLGDPDAVVLVDGAAELVARVRRLGYAAVTFSNQSGVARGLFTEQDVHRVNSRLDELLLDHEPGAVIDRHEFCPHHPEAAVPRYRQASEFRKPAPGMIYQAARQLGLDLSRSWVVGDAPRDIEAGRAAGCRTILFNDPALPRSLAADEPSPVEPDFVAGNLREVAELIENNPPAEEPPEPAPVVEALPDEAVVEAAAEARGGVEEAAAGQPEAKSAPVGIGKLETVTVSVSSPSPGTPGEGWGEGRFSEAQQERPSPCPLPEYREREQEFATPIDSPILDDDRQSDLADEPHSSEVSQEHEQEQVTAVEVRGLPAAAIKEPGSEEQGAAPEQGTPPQPADEQDMDDTSTPGQAESSGAASEGAVRRRTPPAVILAAKAARAAARNSVPEASPEVLREVARNAARAAALGITRDYGTAALPASQAGVAAGESAGAPDDVPVQGPQPGPKPAGDPATETQRYAEPASLAVHAHQRTAADEPEALPAAPAANPARLEDLAEQILLELRQRNGASVEDFSVSKLMAGITMVISLAVLVYAYLYRDNSTTLQNLLLLGLMLQAITISLLIMGRQR